MSCLADESFVVVLCVCACVRACVCVCVRRRAAEQRRRLALHASAQSVGAGTWAQPRALEAQDDLHVWEGELRAVSQTGLSVCAVLGLMHSMQGQLRNQITF